MKLKVTVIALALFLSVAGAVFLRGRAEPLADVTGEVRDLTATPLGLFWIDAPSEPGEVPARLLHLPYGTREPIGLLQAYDLRSVFIVADTLYALLETGPGQASGALVSVGLKDGSQDTRPGLHSPQELWLAGDKLYWTESRAARAEGIVHVPIIRPVNAIRVGDRVGANPRLVTLVEGSAAHFTGRLLGVREAKLYWTEHVGWDFAGGATLVRRGAADSGDPELLAKERGPNVAALDGDHLYWTAYSEELAAPSSGRVARRLDLRRGAPVTITDWLAPWGALLADRGRVRFVGGGWLWRVPSGPDPATAGSAPPVPWVKLSTREVGQVAIYRGNVYAVDAWDGATKIVRRPLSWLGYLSAAMPGCRRPALGPIRSGGGAS